MVEDLLAGLVLFACLTITYTTEITELQAEKKMAINNQPYTLWQLIAVLLGQSDFTLDSVKQVLPIEFTERPRNSFFSPWESESLRLVDQVKIKTVDLRISHKDGISRMLVLDLAPDSACITLEQVRTHFPEGVYEFAPPRFRSPNEKNYYTLRQPWGEISFGFKVRNPDCLASVVIDRTEHHTDDTTETDDIAPILP